MIGGIVAHWQDDVAENVVAYAAVANAAAAVVVDDGEHDVLRSANEVRIPSYRWEFSLEPINSALASGKARGNRCECWAPRHWKSCCY